jgi:integrase/recombinase XerD
MFNQIFVKKHVIQRHINKPFLQERLKYLQYWHESGAARNTLYQIAEDLLVIVDFICLDHKKTFTISDIEKSANKWNNNFCRDSKGKKFKYSSSSVHRLVRTAIRWLDMLKILKYPHKKNNLFSKQLVEYVNYMREEKGLSEKTIKNKVYQLETLFEHLPDKNHLLRKLNSLSIDKILESKFAEGYSRRSIQTFASIIRSFLLYSENQGWSVAGISKSIFSPRIYRYESLPQGPSWGDVKKLLSTTEGDHPNNIRDRAILMLLTIYGFRSSEVFKLRLDDIDWDKKIIFLKRAKNAKPQKLPLSKYAEKSILRYIKKVRPKTSSCKEVFICERAPYRPMGNGAVFKAVSKRWKLFNKDIKPCGPHSLRHACATRLINEGVSLKEISDYLGHQSIDATRIYTKVDLINLRKVAELNIGDLL